MAVIVLHEERENEQFVLLGTGYGLFKAMRGATLGDILSITDEGEKSLAALCGKDGSILWADTSKLTVLSVDGQSPQALLDAS
jgi:hypothetical protein